MGKEDKTIGKLKKEHLINNKFRYQIRLGKNDLQLWTKESLKLALGEPLLQHLKIRQ